MYWFFLSFLILFPLLLQAVYVGPPGGAAGVVEREIQEEFVGADQIDPTRDVPLLDVEIPQEQLDLGDEGSVYISQVALQGNTAFSSKKLQSVLDPYLGKELTMREIKELCRAIQCYYLRRGFFLARAYPPEQEIDNGKLVIEIIEGRLGEISVVGNKYYKTEFICSYFERLHNKPINYDCFVESLLLLNDFDDLTVGAVFKKGAQYGTADLILQVVDCRPTHLYLNTNNFGSSSTTKQRSGGRLDYGNFLLNGDKIMFTGVVGSPIENLVFTEARYSVPVTKRGTFLEASYLYSDFNVGVQRALKLGGRSNIATGRLKQAWHRTRNASTDVYLHFDYKQIKNRAQGATESFDKLRNLGTGFQFDWLDGLRGRNMGDLHLVAGIPDIIGGSSAVDSQSSRLGAGGKYWIYYADYTRIQPLISDVFLLFQLSGQYSNYKLPLAEQIYLGGAEATRGYPVATVLGDKGYHGSLELRTPIPFLKGYKAPFTCKTWREVLQLVFFYDRGQVWLNGGDTINQKNAVTLNGAGAGFRIYGPWHIEWSFDVGFPLTEERKTSNAVYYFKVSWKAF